MLPRRLLTTVAVSVIDIKGKNSVATRNINTSYSLLFLFNK